MPWWHTLAYYYNQVDRLFKCISEPNLADDILMHPSAYPGATPERMFALGAFTAVSNCHDSDKAELAGETKSVSYRIGCSGANSSSLHSNCAIFCAIGFWKTIILKITYLLKNVKYKQLQQTYFYHSPIYIYFILKLVRCLRLL